MKTTIKRITSAFVFAGALLFAPTQSFAAVQNATLPAGGTITIIGMINNYPVAVSWDGSTCYFPFILGTAGTGSLEGYTTVTGSSSGDWIIVADTTGTFCDWTVTPLNTGANFLNVRGGSGDDVLEGRTTANVLLHGDNGDDHVSTVAGGQSIEGENDDDLIIGSNLSTLRGENDDDDLCSQPGSIVWQFIGGLGSDTYCGSWIISPSSASNSCTPCP